MSEHGAVLSQEMIRALPSKISQIAQGLLLTIGIASTGISIAGEWTDGSHTLHTWLVDNVQLLGCTLNLVLVILVLAPGRIRPFNDDIDDRPGEGRIVKAVIRCLNLFCLRAWNWFWVFLGLLYTTILFTAIKLDVSHDVGLTQNPLPFVMRPLLLMDLFNNGSTFFMLLGYCFLSPAFLRRYVKASLAAEHEQDVSLRRWRYWSEFGVSLTIMTTIAAVTVVIHGHIVYWFAPVAVALEKLLALVIGVSSAMAVAYFTGRMDSKFILNWQWAIVTLFLYAAMQSYTAVLYQPDAISKAIFTYGAFTMKCVLFIFVSNFFESKGVIYYAFELVRTGNRSV